jgi:hypothetical protein
MTRSNSSLSSSFLILCLQEERYLPAQVLKPFRKGEAATVRTEDGEVSFMDFVVDFSHLLFSFLHNGNRTMLSLPHNLPI